MNTFLHHNARYEKAKKTKYSIIDEGFFQNILSIYENVEHPDSIKKYIRLIPHTNKLFLFEIDKNKIIERSKVRGYLARETFLNESQKDEWLSTLLSNFENTKKALTQSNYKFFIVDLSAGTNKTLTSIKSKLS